MISLNDIIFYYGAYLYGILLNSLALYLSKKNKHKIFFVILIINTIIFLFFGIPGAIIPYFYFLFLGLRWIYRRFKKSQPLLTKDY